MMDVTAQMKARLHSLYLFADTAAAVMGPGGLYVRDPERRQMCDEDRAFWAALQQLAGLRLIELLVPRLIPPSGDFESQPEEGNPFDNHAFAMKHMDGATAATGISQFVQIVVIARHENSRACNTAKQVDRLAEPDPFGSEITGTDHNVGIS